MAAQVGVAAAGTATGLHRSTSTAVIVHPEYQHTLPAEPIKLSFWECCDDHVLLNIARKLGHAESLVNLQLVNKRCRYIVHHEHLWRDMCIKHFNCAPNPMQSTFSWCELYKFNHKALKYLLAQTTADALMKLGISTTNNNYVLTMHGMLA